MRDELLFDVDPFACESVALEFGGERMTYGDLARACDTYARSITALGIARTQRIAVWTHPSLDTMVALVANAMCGIVSVPINAHVGERELAHLVARAGLCAVVAPQPELVTNRTGALVPTAIRDLWSRGVSASDRSTSAANATPTVERSCVRHDEPALILFTSGTTGAPKGAVLTARNIASNLDGLAAAWNWTARDVLVHALPLFHVHGLVLGLFGSVRRGATLRWLERFTPDAVAHELHTGATMFFGVPTMFHRLADAAERPASGGASTSTTDIASGLARARLLVSGSAPLPVRDHQRIERLCGQRVVERYGLTETLINCAVRFDGDRRAGYVGPPVDGVELRLVDDQRQTLAARDDTTLGEIAVRGPNVFAGYLDQPDATRAVMDPDGWFYTGDLATTSPDGYVRIVGRRATDLIKTGGYKVGAGEVETALLEHAAVAEAAVIGAPDEDLGERIVAFVVLRPDVSRPEPYALTDFVARQLAVHKRPREIHFVDALPRNAMGKVVKSRLTRPTTDAPRAT